ncbi:hypothetical protein DFH11DRAFT_1609396, partial [Phellopilus nigrolimitatus]
MALSFLQRAARPACATQRPALYSRSFLSSFIHTSSVVRQQEDVPPSSDTIYLGKLPPTVQEESVRQELHALGITDFSELRILNEFHKRRVAFGFLRCASPEAARSAMAKIPEDWSLLGFKVEAQYASSEGKSRKVYRPKIADENQLYIGFGALKKAIVTERDIDDELKEALKGSDIAPTWTVFIRASHSAPLTSHASKLTGTAEAEPRRYAFVRFDSKDSARAALAHIKQAGGLRVYGARVIVGIRISSDQPRGDAQETQDARPRKDSPHKAREPSNRLAVRFENSESGTASDVHALLGTLVPESITSGTNNSSIDSAQPTSRLALTFKSSADAALGHGLLQGSTTPSGQVVMSRFI